MSTKIWKSYALRPIDIEITASNILENDYPEYSASTAYAVNDKVMVQAEHRIYKCTQAHSAGAYPPYNNLNTDYWVIDSATNRWNAFDDKLNTATVGIPDIQWTIPAKRSNTAVFFNVRNTAKIKVKQVMTSSIASYPAGAVMSEQEILGQYRNTNGWWEYFFGKFLYRRTMIFRYNCIPNATKLEIEATSLDGSHSEIGTLSIGQTVDLPPWEWGVQAGFRDYSIFEQNETTGETEFLKKGNFVEYRRGTLFTHTDNWSGFADLMFERRGMLTTFIPSFDYPEYAIHGVAKTCTPTAENMNATTIDFEVVGIS